MKNTKIYQWWIKTKETLAPMTWSQRLGHMWTYYKSTVILTAVFVFIIGYVLFGMLTAKTILLGGIHANVELTDAGISQITTEFFGQRGGNANKEEVSTLDVALTPIKDDEYFEMNYYYLQAVISRVGAQQVDYILADKVALRIFMTQDIYMDLRELFTKEQLAEMEERLIYFQPADENEKPTEEKYPVAVDISGLPFFGEFCDLKEPIYFSAAANAPNIDDLKAFWDYLNAWGLE